MNAPSICAHCKGPGTVLDMYDELPMTVCDECQESEADCRCTETCRTCRKRMPSRGAYWRGKASDPHDAGVIVCGDCADPDHDTPYQL